MALAHCVNNGDKSEQGVSQRDAEAKTALLLNKNCGASGKFIWQPFKRSNFYDIKRKIKIANFN